MTILGQQLFLIVDKVTWISRRNEFFDLNIFLHLEEKIYLLVKNINLFFYIYKYVYITNNNRLLFINELLLFE